jgi:hypothetical protein
MESLADIVAMVGMNKASPPLPAWGQPSLL